MITIMQYKINNNHIHKVDDHQKKIYCSDTSKAYFILGIGNSNDRAILASSSVTSPLPVGNIAKLPCV